MSNWLPAGVPAAPPSRLEAEHIVRHVIADPADIEFIPIEHGDMTRPELDITHQLRNHLRALR